MDKTGHVSDRPLEKYVIVMTRVGLSVLTKPSGCKPSHLTTPQVLLFTGYCFQINSGGELTSTASGRAGGLKLSLYTNTSNYALGPRSYAEGFSVGV